MTHWVNTFRPLTAEQYESSSAGCQSAYNELTSSMDELHTSGSGVWDDVEEAPFHLRYKQVARAGSFSTLWVADGN